VGLNAATRTKSSIHEDQSNTTLGKFLIKKGSYHSLPERTLTGMRKAQSKTLDTSQLHGYAQAPGLFG
jgi:hypothetical protein